MANLLYIDDSIDPLLDSYLDKYGKKMLEPFSNYNSVVFEETNTYLDLLGNRAVQNANIILIDSQLFSNGRVRVKYSGEEISLLFRRYFPFIETIIISQNNLGNEIKYVKKYEETNDVDYITYYNNELRSVLTTAQERVHQNALFVAKLEKNNSWDLLIKDKLVNTVNGLLEYDNLTKKDIDDVISAFKALENKIYD